MSAQESLSLPHRFKLPHHPLSHPGRLMRLLRPIVRVTISNMDRFKKQRLMSNTITSQFVSHNIAGFASTTAQQSLEKAFSCCAITLSLQKDINDLTILINSPPEIVLLAVNLYEDLVNEKGIAITTMFALQSSSVDGSEFDAPKADYDIKELSCQYRLHQRHKYWTPR
jgi:hypothetical protein